MVIRRYRKYMAERGVEKKEKMKSKGLYRLCEMCVFVCVCVCVCVPVVCTQMALGRLCSLSLYPHWEVLPSISL